ncbi:MAG: hypothetical protein IT289_12450 [Oligoflexia bacterium]|nr:hypothetical protein [Oligoflexia bacterium]
MKFVFFIALFMLTAANANALNMLEKARSNEVSTLLERYGFLGKDVKVDTIFEVKKYQKKLFELLDDGLKVSERHTVVFSVQLGKTFDRFFTFSCHLRTYKDFPFNVDLISETCQIVNNYRVRVNLVDAEKMGLITRAEPITYKGQLEFFGTCLDRNSNCPGFVL